MVADVHVTLCVLVTLVVCVCGRKHEDKAYLMYCSTLPHASVFWRGR